MPAPLWTHDQRYVRDAPLGPRVDSGTRLYFYDLNGPRNVNGKIPGAPHGMMWSATGPMAMHNGDYVDGTTRWLEGYVSAVSPDNSEGYFRHVRVDLRSFAVPCRVLVWGGREDRGGTGARWLVLARGLAYDTPPTRRREPAEMALTLAKRDHDWLSRAHGGDKQSQLICEKIFSDDWRAAAPHGIPARLLDAYNLAPCATAAALARLRMPLSPSPLDIHNLMGAPDPTSWRAIREYPYMMPAVQTGAGSGWAADYLGHPTKPCSACAEMGWAADYLGHLTEPCPACAEMDGWGCREHQIKI